MLVSLRQLIKETNRQFKSSDPNKRVSKSSSITDLSISPEDKSLLKSATAGNVVRSDLNLAKRKEMIFAKGFEPGDFAYDRAIGKNDSLYSNFAELIAFTKRKVGRIVIKEDNKKSGYATGFMVSNRLMLTNWHVFKNKEMADESELHFFYEYDAQGHPLTPVIFRFDTSHFFNNEELDYCFVAVQPSDVTKKYSLDSVGYLYLDKTLGKIGDVNVERLNIIHHPQGDYKQISIRENTFTGINAIKIFYITDTARGSSGSPVFNDQWQVVGLHHKSIAKMTDDEKDYLDKDDNIIPVIDGKIDESRIVWKQNEGIRISVILNHLLQMNPNNEIISTLAIPPPLENLHFAINDVDTIPENKGDNIMDNNSNNNININVPTSALSTDHSIEISLSSKNVYSGTNLKTSTTQTGKTNELLLEVAKAEKEQDADFSKCKGYLPKFLGVEIRLPRPKKIVEKQIARLKDNGIELKYYKHSVIFNAVSKMPFISGVNVEGDATKRLDDSKRSDYWLRDKRIDLECQLTDKFYSGSNFDKGHMARFEDANWGNTEADALRNGIYTCFYTNACPQVVDLNRAGGLWGKLEKAVLEKGIKKERRKQAKMSVFNGPIFNEDKDRIFKGVIIPMEYYKIILWLNDDNKLKATAFKLSQETLVDDIKFDESMRIEEEALDIDKDVVFKNYQCSIKSLASLTNIDFKQLEQYDTFKSNNGGEEIFIDNEETMLL
ncbi:MAG: DNA/RNA non-specific endonuclease [Ignavibacteriales bacterium]|nr:DNA/RNA non-specific endonuclease [Ignavibacteriales bacterium]